MKLIFYFGFLCSLNACYAQNCDKLSSRFNSYDEAIKVVEHTYFKIEESANTSKSSWIEAAYYYGCDGKTGYFIGNYIGV